MCLIKHELKTVKYLLFHTDCNSAVLLRLFEALLMLKKKFKPYCAYILHSIFYFASYFTFIVFDIHLWEICDPLEG